jgi:hypothetical protein
MSTEPSCFMLYADSANLRRFLFAAQYQKAENRDKENSSDYPNYHACFHWCPPFLKEITQRWPASWPAYLEKFYADFFFLRMIRTPRTAMKKIPATIRITIDVSIVCSSFLDSSRF